MRYVLVLFLTSVCLSANADELPRDVIDRAIAAYLDGHYDAAFATLSHLPGFLGVVPLFDHPGSDKTRAQIFFDMGRMRMAFGDTAGARFALARVIALDAQNRRGILPLPRDDAYEKTRSLMDLLYQQQRKTSREGASLEGAVIRSAVLPGWGQIYRGRRLRGRVFLGAALAFAATYVIADQTHRKTPAGGLAPETRYEPRMAGTETARGRTASLALVGLVGVWAANVLDHVFVGPSRVALVLPIP